MTQEPKDSSTVAVVILNWNGLSHLETYLPSVLAHTPHEVGIWVVDNGSSDESVPWLKMHMTPRVGVIELEQNHGFAGGYNRALDRIDADLYVLLNSDVRIPGPWIQEVVHTMNVRDWDVASPLVVQDADPDRCEHAGAAGGLMDRDGFPFCIGRIFGHCSPVTPHHEVSREVFWASGACLFIRQSAWNAAGGFDESLFAHMEEIDLCWRLKNEGHRVGCVGHVRVRHLGGGTLQVDSPRKVFLNFRNNLVVMLKNRDGWWPGFVFRRMLLDGLAAWRFLFSGHGRLFLAVGLAHAQFYARLWGVLRHRRTLRNSPTRRPNRIGWWPHSLVWAHFIRGNKLDTELPFIDDTRSLN